jgi:DNA-binding transcriptional LysR family regulator
MPRLARLWEGETFSPAQSEGHIRLAMNDYASSVVLAPLAEICGRLAPGITLEAVPWHERFHEESGLVTTHLILSPLSVPATFRAEPLFDDVFVCVLGRKLKHRKASLTMKDYLSFRHISVETQPNQQNLIDRLLEKLVCSAVWLSIFPTSSRPFSILETTDLALTMPARIAEPTWQRFMISSV